MVIWMIGIIAYMIFHELIHGVFMKTSRERNRITVYRTVGVRGQ